MGRRAVRSGYLLFGLLCVGLGFIGIVVPVMPTTVFFILALWAFKRSSPSLEAWLLERSPVASTLQDWDREKAIAPRTKRVAISMVWVGIGASVALLVWRRWAEWRAVISGGAFSARLMVAPSLIVVALVLTWYIASRKTKKAGT